MKKNKRFKLNLTKIYLFSFVGFLSAFTFIFLTPIFSGGSYSYAEAVENQYITLGNSTRISILKKEFNPTNGIMRLDFSLEGTTSTSNLSDITFDVVSRNVKDKKVSEVELIRVNDEYMILLIKNVPKKYGVLSTTISPKYIRPELDDNSGFDGKNVKFYVNQSDEIINEKLEIEDESYYQKEYISFKQLEIVEEINEKETEIEKEKLLIFDDKDSIDNLKLDMEYQTEDEKFETKNEINSKESSKLRHKNNIELLKEEIKQLEEKSKLLEKKKNSF